MDMKKKQMLKTQENKIIDSKVLRKERKESS